MITTDRESRPVTRNEVRTETELVYQTWNHWPINWSSVWVGALTAFAILVVLGLAGIALGAQLVDSNSRLVDYKKVHFGSLAFVVAASFFSFVAAGWAATKIAGILRSEPAMLHGAIVWVVTVPIIVAAGALGAGSFLGTWYSGLAGTPAWAPAAGTPFVRPDAPSANASPADWDQHRTELAAYRQKVNQWNEETPKVTRNSALGAVGAALLGLIGAVLGGWLGCGEPMSVTYYRRRPSAVNLD